MVDILKYNMFNQDMEEIKSGNKVIMDLPTEISSTEDVKLYLTYVSRVFNELDTTFDDSGVGGTFVSTRENRTIRELCMDTQHFVEEVLKYLESEVK